MLRRARNKTSLATLIAGLALVCLCVPMASTSAIAAGPGVTKAETKSDPKADALSEADARRVMTEVVKERVNRLVARFVPSNDFVVAVQVKPAVPLLADVPYVPAVQTAALLLEMAPEDLKAQYTELRVDVRISQRFDDESRATIAALIQADLGLSTADSVKVTKLQVKAEATDGALLRQLESAQADLRQARTEMEQIKRERNDAKNELMLKNSLPKNTPEQKVAAGPLPETPKEKPAEQPDPLLTYAPMAAAGILLFLAVLLSSKMFASAIRTVGSGINLIANSLSSVGGALKVKAETEAEEKKSKASPVNVQPPAPGAAAGQNGGTAGSGISGDLYERILRLSRELLDGLNERTEGVLLKTLSSLLARPETAAKGVATLELLGKNKANEMFGRLGTEARGAVQAFLLDGNYGRPKFELMLESGEELKTRLLGEGFGQLRGEFTIKMAEEILRLSSNDSFQIAATLPNDLKARYFVYLEPDVLSGMVTRFELERKDQFEAVVDSLAFMAKVERDTSLDDAIVQFIREFLAKKVDDPEARYVPHFRKIIESLAGDLAEKTVDRLGATNPGLKMQLAKYVVTFRTLFKLPLSIRKEALDPFSNKQLAALAFGVVPSLRSELMSCILERRHEQINDEIGFLAEMNVKDTRAIVEAAQAAVVATLKKMRDNGSLQEHLEAAENSAPAANLSASPVKSAA